MSERENAQVWRVREQIVEDPASGLTLQFEVAPDGENTLRIYGDLPYGNRTLSFTADGRLDGRGTLVSGLCKPAWPERPLAPSPHLITADWLREQGWNCCEEAKEPSLFLMELEGDFHLELFVDPRGWRPEIWYEPEGGEHMAALILPVVHTTADLANLVAALRGGGA